MPDPQGSQSMWWKQRCSKLLFTHDLIARGRMLQPVVFLSWTPAVCTCEGSNGLPAPSGHCQGGCEILCPLPCFPNWLEYAGQAPGRVYYILSGLRVMDPFQVQKWHTSCPGRVSVTSGRPSSATLSGGKGREWQRKQEPRYHPHPGVGKHPATQGLDGWCAPLTCRSRPKTLGTIPQEEGPVT